MPKPTNHPPCAYVFNNAHPILFPNETIVSKLTDQYVACLPLDRTRTSNRAMDLSALATIQKASIYITVQRLIVVPNQPQSSSDSFCMNVLDINQLFHHKDAKKSYYWSHSILDGTADNAGVSFQLSLIFASQTSAESFSRMIKNIQFIHHIKSNLPKKTTPITKINTEISNSPVTRLSDSDSLEPPLFIENPHQSKIYGWSSFQYYNEEADYDYLPTYQESKCAAEMYKKREYDLQDLTFRQTLNI
ncbi:hypothetical protein NADFUDRAFT_50759 [Nadsonia fulvescens var. elongata DSM 6958]|uniref:Uncharacterized protein n=1 Tax=Nadsonia fulvescens var. elongata DSM 6958 TaxID=857566 RepID=A0A1E3PN43_9ASCO|nr:hypothetical protein NADFUDRAFT_50759 [Nadsonia fulvescens var. elongata DSM 6958]